MGSGGRYPLASLTGMSSAETPVTGTGRRGTWQRLMFPPGAGREFAAVPRERDLPRDRWVDAGFLVGAAVFGGGLFAVSRQEHGPVMLVVDLVLGCCCLLGLPARRRYPVTVAAVAVAASAVSVLASGPALVALFSGAIRLPGRIVATLAVAEVVATGILPLVYNTGDVGIGLSYWSQLVIGTLINLVAVGWGLLVGMQRRYLAAVIEQASLAQAKQRLLATTAQDAERRRIAREMHDVLGHRLSLLSVHAGALQFRADLRPETVREIAEVIRQASHDALDELHDVVTALRESPEATPSLHPPLTIADIPSLVDQSLAAGAHITVDHNLDDLAADAGRNDAASRTTYRIVQECLTNARKHAPESPIHLTMTTTGAKLTITACTRLGHGPRPAVGSGSGTGLTGLAERVALTGGTFDHHVADGRFVVEATLPWVP